MMCSFSLSVQLELLSAGDKSCFLCLTRQYEVPFMDKQTFILSILYIYTEFIFREVEDLEGIRIHGKN